MRHLGKLVRLLLLTVNTLFVLLLLLTAYSPYITPTEHPMLSCMGLTFPIFACINGCFLIFWLICCQYKAALLPLAAFLLCYPQLHSLLPLNFGGEQQPEGSIKLLSYNVMGFNGTAKEKSNDNSILNYLKRSGADIICLQEYATANQAGGVTQKEVEKALKAYPYHRINTVGSGQGGHTNQLACYSKYPILTAHTLRYESAYNGSVCYTIRMGKDTLTLINNHLESNKLEKEEKEAYEEMLRDPEKEKVKSNVRQLIHKLSEAAAIRAPQADSIAREVARRGYRHTVVCGDFNDTPISYAHHTIAKGLKDAFTTSGCGPGFSYNKNKFYFRIDNILHTPDLQAHGCKVDRSIGSSDHYPIWCYLSRKSNDE
ncbi:MAG: endonuclease/exonuclease/phosphatase family protein [Bacteroides sp.]|nr:endonuclease/exonuclease/phosphatase family protein [Bacteroides sp.]